MDQPSPNAAAKPSSPPPAAPTAAALPGPTPSGTPSSAPPEVKRFMAWVERTAPLISKNPRQLAKPSETQCYTDKSEPAYGLCMADLQVHSDDASTYSLNWAQKEPGAFKVSAILPSVTSPVSCGHLGGTRLSLSTGTTPIGGGEERCSLPGERQALIQRVGPVLNLHVFSAAYLRHDPELGQ